MSKLRVFLLCAIFVLGAGNLFAQTTYTWIGSTGDWDVSANWTPTGVPGTLDTAIVNGGTITLNAGVTVANLEIAANLNGDFDLEVTNLMVWNGQSIRGSGTLTISATATLRLAGSNQQTLQRSLVNNGTTIWEAGNFYMDGGNTFTNNGSFVDQHSGTEPFSGGLYSCSFTNDGTYTKTGTGESRLTIPFHNNGSLELQYGSMNLSYSGNSSGSITVGSGSILRFQGYTSRIISGPVSGEGTIEFSATTTTIQGIYNITGSTRFASNTTIFDTSATILSLNHGQELVISGTAEFNTGDPLVLDSLYLTGHLQGSDSVAILESMNWASGVVQGSGGLNITVSATLRLSGTNQQTLYRNLVNNGTTIWEAGHFYLGSAITFTNNGSFLDQHSSSKTFSGGIRSCSFINNDSYTKTGDSQSRLDIPFYNDGSLELEAGSFQLNYYTTSSGAVSIADGALLQIQGNSSNFTGPITGEGNVEFWSSTTIQGIYNITGSTRFASNTTIYDTSATIISLNHGQELVISGRAEFNTGDPVSIDSLYLTGHLQGSDSIAILKSMNWSSNVVQGSGTLNIIAGATLRLSGGNQQTLYRNLVNNGTTIWEAGNFYLGSAITFTNNGSFLDQHSGTEPFSGGTRGCTLVNNGTYTKTGTGLSGISLPFYNNPSGEIRGIGSMSLSSGFTNEGSVSPGDSLGSLYLTVDYPTTTTSDLNIEIGGTTVDSLYDQLNITGDATLGGTLNISLVNDFIPALGDTFVIITYNSYTGDFSEINGLDTGSGVSFEVNIGATDIKLITTVTPNSAPSVFNLLAPADEVVLSKIDTINFVWQESSDADDDALDYTLNIFGGTLDTLISDITDTALAIIDGQFWEGNTEYQWTLLVTDGIFTTVSPDTFSFTTPIIDAINDDNLLVPIVFALEQNYPNPFNPKTVIRYALPITGHIDLSIYNMLGQKVATLVSEEQTAGNHKVNWDASNFPSGVYFCRLDADGLQQVRRMLLIK